MLAKCAATKKDGTPCSLSALGSSLYCWAHNPDNAEARKKVAATGGKGKAAKNRTVYEELHALAEWHKELAVMVREGRITRATAQTMSNLLNNAASAYRASIKAKETEELEAQIAELEDLFRREQQEDLVNPWGA
ncbi:MAG TPA: hypothetical protein VK361_07820 [Rubrobacteraceae bacterium]|nr:hypothetical protein [Rubrobacteraceae bacterium]